MEKYNLDTSTVALDKSLVESQYTKMERDREQYLERAREVAKLTIPHLYPPTGANEATEYPTPYQSVGSRGVTNLASKLMLALFPPQAPFFRLDVDELVYKQIEGDPKQKATIEQGLAKIEKAVMDSIETNNDRVAVYEALKHLIVSGNVLLKMSEDGLRTYPLNNYVVKRDPQGKILKIIIKEGISPNTLSDKLRKNIGDKLNDETKSLNLFTCIYREKKRFYVHQEIAKQKVFEKYYDLDKLPFIALRFNRIDGMNYGRGHCETFEGDLRSLEGLTRAILEGSSASSKMLFMISPNGSTRASSIAKAPNGAIIEGNAQDVSVLQANKFADFRVGYEMMGRIEQRLQFAFLLNASVQRQAERVTATEVQLVANELNDALGGVYGILTTEFQLPYINTKLNMLKEQKLLPNLPKELVKTKIIVGMEALGRASDRLRLLQFMSDLANTLGAERLAQYINLDDAIKKFAVANGIDTGGLIKSQEQIQQEAQAQQQQQFANQALADPRVAIEAGRSLANSGATVNANGEIETEE
ncbi:head-to-tail joining protein [uncultured phage_MedDCM-OCT-S30-C28]|uniref:Head-to-tail joining protein n=1 Tax=uncultured phage_MedDCM-OCT-S30-C28 TaxID=2741076 RepID=A0A6S4P9Y3_9CAUD|nr:head-to-tail joining protein [uncultured phage_MedDCM-OCT-S30-C28]BAQ94232.1 head-to-tail joining protein [uncultured phage_MedDCM-OCT-S30-C28]